MMAGSQAFRRQRQAPTKQVVDTRWKFHLWYSLLTESALGDACSRVAEGCADDATDKEVDSMSIAELRSLIHEAAAAAAAAVAV